MFTLRDSRPWVGPALAGAALAAGVLWAFSPALADMARRWADDPHYSHGFLVPAFAAALLWLRRGMVRGRALRPSWWGVAFLLAAAGLRAAGGFLYVDWFNQLALLPTLAGICLLCGGWAALRWAWPAVVFLFFMIPLPYRVQVALGGPLQHLATVISTYLLQTLGFPAIAEGNIIRIDDFQIGVVEACNGLGMLLTFVALAAAVVLVAKRPALDQALILASSIPIAVASNVLRITVTAALSKLVNNEAAGVFFHDLAGWFMMPVALVLLLAELALLRRLLVEAPAPAPIAVTVATTGRAPRRRGKRAAARV